MRIIAGEARGKPLLSPRDRSARPPLARMRESLFSFLESAIERGGVLDLFAGVGTFGLEALSRGARRAVFVEQDATNFDLLSRNIERLGFASRSRAVRGDALRIPDLTREAAGAFGLVFIDPPFKMFASSREGRSLRTRVREILSSPALAAGGVVVLRVPATEPIDREFPEAKSKRYGTSKVLVFGTERSAPNEGGESADGSTY